MVFGKATSFEEHELEYWRHVDPSLKFQAIVELVQDSCCTSGENGPDYAPVRFAHGTRKIGS